MKKSGYYTVCGVILAAWVLWQASIARAQMNASVPVTFIPYKDPWASAKER